MRIKTLSGLLFLPFAAVAQTHNTVQNWVSQKPITLESEIVDPARTPFEVVQSTQFMDGFGRTVQTVSKKTSPLQQDAVSFSDYDTWGRQVRQYLPFVSGNNGLFKSNPLTLQANFYQAAYPGETGFYSEVSLENSPSQRVTKTMSPGSSWVGSSRGVSTLQLVNTATDAVRVWNVNLAAGSLPASSATYTEGQLHKIIIKDERDAQIIEYKNKDGQIILKKAQMTASADPGSGSVHAGWICTYYVYDDYGNLRYILTPKVIEAIDGSWTLTQNLADELCYRYEYDDFNRVIISKNPGTPSGSAGELWYIYDQRGRMVMRQDGNRRALHQWEYFRYDREDRPVATGLLTDNANYANRTYHQNIAKNYSADPSYPDLSSYPHQVLTETYYDNYNWTTAAGMAAALDQTNTSNTNIFLSPSNSVFPYPQPIVQTIMTRGLVTGSKTAVLDGGSQFLYSVTFYDDKGRIIQTQSTNLEGTDKVTMQYGWSGMLLRSYYEQQKTTGRTQEHNVLTKMNYGHMGRLQSVSKKINSSISTSSSPIVINGVEKTVATFTYNELGQLVNKKIGINPSTNVELESLDFDYNVRGWLTGINKGFTQWGVTGRYFGEEIGYDKTATASGATFANPSYIGTTSGVVWKSKGDAVPRKYDFAYDNVLQLTGAPYQQSTGASSWASSYMDFSVNSMSYDLNGNIKSLNQNGFVLGGGPAIDNLNYYYQNTEKSNKLQTVIDLSNNPTSKLGDFHYTGSKTPSSVDYGYDNNGNRTSDINKSISAIEYNELGLPRLITIAGKGTIAYVYDAAGNKLRKRVLEPGAAVTHEGNSYVVDIETVTTYFGNGFVYLKKSFNNSALEELNVTDALQFISQEEGRARIVYPLYGQSPYYAYDYFIRDRLGNVRVTLTDEQQQDTYPAATLETSGVSAEKKFYQFTDAPSHIIPTSSLPWWSLVSGNSYQNNNNIPVPPDPTINPTATSSKLYKLNGQTGDRFGLGITLKVMAGDAISIFGKSVWHDNGATTNNSGYNISSILTSFIDAFAGTNVVLNSTKGTVTGTLLNGNSPTISGLNSILGATPTPGGQTPKAYINWILFDEQFKPVQSGGGFDPVSTSAHQIKNHSLPGINISKSGYLYVYCSNESNQDVYFDNVQVIHTRSALIEEHHYYPAGLAMYALSSKAYNKLQVNFGYQGKEMQAGEFFDGTGLEEYDFAARYYDPQLGRWWNQDPANQFNSPYNAMGNNWPNSIDPTGTWAFWDDIIVAGIGFLTGYITSGIVTGNWGWRSVKAGLVSAGMFMIGYYSGGASSAGNIAGVFSSSGLQGHANTVALAFAGKSALTSAIGSIMPGMSIPIGDFSIGISAGLGISGGSIVPGINVSAGYDDGNFRISGGVGSFGNSRSWGGGVTYKGFGLSYAQSKFSGEHTQKTGAWTAYGWGGSLKLDNDIFAEHQDRWRTGGVEIGIGNFVIGARVYTNYTNRNEGVIDKPSPTWGPNNNGYKTWENGKVFSSPAWVGYRNGNQVFRYGYSHWKVQDVAQNGLHQSRTLHFANTHYFLDYSEFNKGIFNYYGYYNPYSLY